MSYQDQAVGKLKSERKAAKYDRYAQVMKDRVCETVEYFCRENEEFAQAVVQGGSFGDCMKDVAAEAASFGNGHGIPDLEAFRRAVRFYFPGADVKFHMTLDLCGDIEREEQTSNGRTTAEAMKAIVIDINEFF